ncbi:related to nitrogen metabolic regulation protein nmr [Fusarium oxysporum]|uniref:Related to nitrogen metabolic regulation protein nmr n=1 Tax=Fusarium oxysporum TaxID=5507 RepID=A0A2H3TUQ4_FUSOX|nr:related to nitrogen metabolic regulation protein nmr [Fusarium oxysporum]
MTVSTILAIGSTGAQGIPDVRGLVFDGHYAVKVLARDTQSPHAQELASVSPKVQILEGTFTSEVDLINGLQGSQGSFLNIDSFTIGEKAEMMAFYNMTMATFTMGTYIEMAICGGNPVAPQVVIQKGEEVVIWRVPLTQPGAVVHVSLEYCAYSWHWLFDHPQRDGIDLEVASEYLRFFDVTLEQYWIDGPMSKTASAAAGIEAGVGESDTLTVKEDFTGFWNMWRDSGGNDGVIKRDYELLDKFHPNRIRSVERFFRLANER